jgi:RND superfamily putative drug exporter
MESDTPDGGTVGRLAKLPASRRGKWAVLALWLVIFAIAGPLSGKLQGIMSNDAVNYLPHDAQSTQVLQLSKKFSAINPTDAVVVYYRASGLTPTDRQKAAADLNAVRSATGVVGPVEPIPSAAGTTQAMAYGVPVNLDDKKVVDQVKHIRDLVEKNNAGMTVYVGGPAGGAVDQFAVFNKIDGPLLYTAGFVVVLLLLLTYRSPFLWLVPLACVLAGLVAAMGVTYLLAAHAGLTVTGLSQGILLVLTMGVGTDYALLLVARYREELRRHEDKHEAMAIALHRAGPAIIASGTTVILSMLCLLISVLNSDRSLGPVAALGVLCALVAMLTLLPALLVAVPRRTFWPKVPHYGDVLPAERTFWGRVGTRVSARPRSVWIVTSLILAVLALGFTTLKSTGLTNEQSYPSKPESVKAQVLIDRYFSSGTGAPVEIVANAGALQAVSQAITANPNVSGVKQVGAADGLVKLDATMRVMPDSTTAYQTIDQLRGTLGALPGADAKVGGYTATALDVQNATGHDRDVVIPVVLAVVFLILILLLRSLLAPLLLMLTVGLSFGAAVGASWLVYEHLLHFAGSDTSYPLYSFLFLVALGIDYNIFLMTRVREESQRVGTRTGVLRGLATTGGVITSAGIVLAATFAVLGVLPLVTMIEVGSTVAFGVLLDTMIVRSVLVPALVFDIGDRVWWPSRLTRGATHPAREITTAASGSQRGGG